MRKKLSRNETGSSSPYNEVARVSFRLYDDEIDQAERITQKLKIHSVNQAFKYLLLNAEKLNLIEKNNLLQEKEMHKQKLHENKLMNELRRIGVNVNQIAFKINSSDTQSNIFLHDIHRELIRIERSLKEIAKKVGG